MAKAIWNGAVLAVSDQCRVVEGNHYFPADSVRSEYLKPSSTRTTCPWKGVASYFNIVVDGEVNIDAAWVYPETTTPQAREIEGFVAFWKGVDVQPD